MQVQFEGTTYNFPDDATDAEISQALAQPTDRSVAFDQDPTSLIPGAEQRMMPQPQPEPSLLDMLKGAGETALTVGSGMTGGTVGLIDRTISQIAKEAIGGQFGTPEAADRVEQAGMQGAQAFTYAPRTPVGQQYAGAVGRGAQELAPLAGLGPQMAALSRTTQPLALQGRQAIQPALRALEAEKDILRTAVEPVTRLTRMQTPAKRAAAEKLEMGIPDVETAKLTIDKPRISPTIGPTVKKDVPAVEAVKQGFDEGVIATIKGASKVDKARMRKMVDVLESGKKNTRFAALNRPSDVVGDTLLGRVKTIRTANKQAGQDIDRVANTLRGKPIDVTDAVTGFGNTLDEMGVRMIPKGEGFIPDFKLSQLAPGDRGPIKEVIRQMNLVKGMDAFSVHRMKRVIDNNVTYGKTKTGMSGDAERALKAFRASLDEALDTTYPAYNKANVKYSETINALNSIRDLAGKSIDLSGGQADKALGTLLRRTLSNAQSRVRLLDSLDDIEAAASKYGGLKSKMDADILNQVIFADELDKVFGPVARTSFQGQIDQAIQQGARAATSKAGAADVGVSMLGKGLEKARGINEANAIKAIRELLK